MSENMSENKEFVIRKSVVADIGRMLAIYEYARNFMAENGNAAQWGPNRWPPEELLRQDIAEGRSYICECGGRTVGTFCYIAGVDIEPTYARIYDGAWRYDEPYGVVHRLAGDGSVPGIGAACINWALAQCGYLRIDTHGNNIVMQRLLTEKLGFWHSGTIYVEQDDDPRLAYERKL